MPDSCLRIIQAKTKAVRHRKSVNNATISYNISTNNVYMNDWDKVATHFLSIPMAHQFIGDYTIADAKDEQLKVLRSYQYYAVNKIADTVAKTDWTAGNQRGG